MKMLYERNRFKKMSKYNEDEMRWGSNELSNCIFGQEIKPFQRTYIYDTHSSGIIVRWTLHSAHTNLAWHKVERNEKWNVTNAPKGYLYTWSSIKCVEDISHEKSIGQPVWPIYILHTMCNHYNAKPQSIWKSSGTNTFTNISYRFFCFLELYSYMRAWLIKSGVISF